MAKANQYFPQHLVSHPGRELGELLEELEMGPKEFAVRTNKPEQTISAILKGDSSITPDMAVLFETVTRVPAHYWLSRQQKHDESKARHQTEAQVAGLVAWAKQFPVFEMLKKSWLPPTPTWPEKAQGLLAYFQVASDKAWENYYCKSQLKVQFRLSLTDTREPQALSAWLRRGELQAQELAAPPYSEAAFKAALPALKQVMATHPANFFDQLRELCRAAGVRVVHTPCLPKAPISGATRWLKPDQPLLQLSGRYRRNDSFWFTFFHEAGHILLHGSKEIFLESVDYAGKDDAKEKEADAFAVKWVFPEAQEQELLEQARHKPLNEASLVAAAQHYGTHPAIILGRLQHKKLVRYSVGREFFAPVQLDEGATC